MNVISKARNALLQVGPLRRRWRKFRSLPLAPIDLFLRDCSSIVHLGANTGHERFLYDSLDIDVVWIEAVPSVFDVLVTNLRGFKKQKALNALVADIEGKNIKFNIANNEGASSSIYDFDRHIEIWPEVCFTESIELKSTCLDHLLDPSKIIDALVMDIQGAELLALKGAARLLKDIKFIKTEAADFSAYAGGCTLEELSEFLRAHGFRELSRNQFASNAQGEGCYDVLFSR